MKTRRMLQFNHVYDTIDSVIPNYQKQNGLEEKYPADMSFEELKSLLTEISRVMDGVRLDRYVAMVKSVARGASNEDDVMSWRDL